MQCHCCLRNVLHLLADGQTPYERWFNSPFEGPTFPFGAEVKFYPRSPTDQGRVHQFGTNVLPGICMGYAFNGRGSWTGDLWIADTEDLKTMPPCRTAEILRDRQALSTGVYKAGGDLRRESQQTFSEEREEARGPGPDVEPRQDFCSIMEDYTDRNQVESSTKIYVLEDDFPILLNYIDVHRQVITSIDLLQDATIDNYWNVDGDKSLSEPWIDVTRFALLNKNPPEGYMWVLGRLTKKQVATRPRNTWPEEWSNLSQSPQRKEIND